MNQGYCKRLILAGLIVLTLLPVEDWQCKEKAGSLTWLCLHSQVASMSQDDLLREIEAQLQAC